MSALYICVAAWLALNAATFAILMLRPDRRDNDAWADEMHERPSPIVRATH
jgi:hypothetical protein